MGAVEHARQLGAVTIAITSVPGSLITKTAEISIVPVVGPEVIAGSTRMKAGTALLEIKGPAAAVTPLIAYAGGNRTIFVSTAPTGSAAQSFCNAATAANLTATGTNIQWYAAATGGTPLPGTTPLINGNHYYASQTAGPCESVNRLSMTRPRLAGPLPTPHRDSYSFLPRSSTQWPHTQE